MSRALAVLLLITCVQAGTASAQSPLPIGNLRELSLEELGSLEVETVAKQPSEIWRSPAAVFVLTQDDIRRSGATTLPEVMRQIPGVQVSRLDSDHWAVGVRGLASAFSKSLLVLIDGRSVYTPLFGGVYWQVEDTLIEDIERLEVIRGPGGTIWGANAVNGVINIVTKNSRDTIGAAAAFGAGNVDQGRVGFRYGGRSGDGLTYRVYGNAFSRDAGYHSDNKPFDVWKIAQAGFRVDRLAPGGAALVVQGDVYRGSAGDSVAVGMFFPPEQRQLSGLDRVSGGNVLARWQRSLQGGGDLRLQVYYDRTNRDAIHFREARNSVDVDFLHHSRPGSRHNLSLGAGARFNPADFTSKYQGLTFTPEDRAHRLFSAFAQDEIGIVGERLWLTVGSKLEHNSYSGLELQPSARLLWRRHARETLWTAVTRAVRTPSRVDTELRLTGYLIPNPLAYIVVKGSPDFEAESLVGTEVGYRRLVGSQLYLDITAFHNQHRDLAGFGPFQTSMQPRPVPHMEFALSYKNAIRGTTDGFEFSPDWRPASWLRLKGGYAFLTIDMENQPGFNDRANVSIYEGTSPRHQGFVQASLTLPGRVEIDHSYRASSRLRYKDVPGYLTADARFGWQFARGLTLGVAGHNLLQSHHVEFSHEAIPPVGVRRSVYANLTWRR